MKHLLLKLQLLKLPLKAVFIGLVLLLLLLAVLCRSSSEHLLLDLLECMDAFV